MFQMLGGEQIYFYLDILKHHIQSNVINAALQSQSELLPMSH